MLDWRVLFFLTAAIGLVIIVPLCIAKLKTESEAPHSSRNVSAFLRVASSPKQSQAVRYS